MTTQLKNLTTTENTTYSKKGELSPSACSPAHIQSKGNNFFKLLLCPLLGSYIMTQILVIIIDRL